MNKNRKLHFDKMYLKMAQLIANNSYAEKKKVGSLVVKNRTIISDGFNGTPAGFPNGCEYNIPSKKGKTLPEVLHAEENAITKLASSTNSSSGATMYITIPPCSRCARLIIQSNITRVVYVESYKNEEGIILLELAGVKIEQIEIS